MISDLNPRIVPTVHVHTLDLRNVGADLTMDSTAGNADKHAEIDGGPTRSCN